MNILNKNLEIVETTHDQNVIEKMLKNAIQCPELSKTRTICRIRNTNVLVEFTTEDLEGMFKVVSKLM